MKNSVFVHALFALMIWSPLALAQTTKPTVVLVHGAFADASGWSGVIELLHEHGYHVVAAANPLRGVKSDAAGISDLLSSIKSPIVLVGHSYGGSVISAAANGHDNVKALVYVAGFAPDVGENALALSGKFPGSTLGSALAAAVLLAGGGKDLYIDQGKFNAQCAADIPASVGGVMAATQRPVAEAALAEPSPNPAWTSIPACFIYSDQDKNVPPHALA